MRRLAVSAGMVVMVGGVGVLRGAGPAATQGGGGGSGFVLEIGHDTTRVMGPKLADGTIDYGHALWEAMHAGVTEENNGYGVLAGMAEKFKKVPEKLQESADGGADDPLDQSMRHPWKAGDYPGIEAWLKDNAVVLDAARGLVETEKGRALTRWCPPEPAAGAEFKAWPWGARLMEVGEALDARAMERLGSGDQAGARADAEAMVRLGDLAGSEPVLVATLEQQRMEAYPCRVALAGARLGTAAEKQQWLAFVEKLPELRMNPQVEDVQWRFDALGEVMKMVRGDLEAGLEETTQLNLTNVFVAGANGAKLIPGDLSEVDWNVVLRKINAQVDEEVKIAAAPGVAAYRDAKTMAERVKGANVPENVFDAVLGPSLESPQTGSVKSLQKSLEEQVNAFVRRREGESVAAFSERIAAWMTRGDAAVFYVVPEHTLDAEAERRASAVAIGLEIYKGEHGAYPETLVALVPGILKAVPADPWAADGAALRYAQEKGEYAVYSVGSSGEDRPRGADGRGVRSAVYSEKGREVVSVGEAATRP